MNQSSNATNTTVYGIISNFIVTVSSVPDTSKDVDVMMTFRLILSSVGILGNLTVVIVFLNHKKLRKKIPNIFIIHQVSVTIFTTRLCTWFYINYFILYSGGYTILLV